MSNLDIELYLSQLMKFFEENPTELKTLIGDCDKALFFEKIKEQCFFNLEKGDDVILTQTQLINVVRDLVSIGHIKVKEPIEDIVGAFQDTNLGRIYLN